MAILYVQEQGSLLKHRGELLTIVKDGKVVQEVPVLKLTHVLLFGNVQITAQAMDLLLEQGVDVGLRVPLSLNSGAWSRSARIGVSGGLTRVYDLSPFPDGTLAEDETWAPSESGLLRTATAEASYSQSLWSSSRALGPRWGFSANVVAKRTLPGSDWDGSYGGASGTLRLPGFGRLHSASLGGSYETQDRDGYIFGTHLAVPRGYTYTAHDTAARVSASYDLPLFNIDRGLGPVIFVQRVRAGLFYDLGWGVSDGRTTPYPSVGGTLTVDACPLRFPASLEMGAQLALRLDGSGWDLTPVMAGVSF